MLSPAIADAPFDSADVVVLRKEIARREKLERELQQARDAAEEANAAKDEFLGRISHELRAPLTPVLLGLSDLSTSSSVPAEIRDQMAVFQHYVEMAATLIDDLMNINEMSSRKPILRLRPMDIHDAVSAAVSTALADLDGQNATTQINLDLEADVSSIQGDPVMVEQVLWNLLCNASKFTPSTGHIQIRTGNGQQTCQGASVPAILIDIIDDGAGIRPELLPRLFTPFTRGQQPKGMPDGFGIGLAYSRNIIEAHGGSISVESEGVGKGTTVHISLPTSPEGEVAATPCAPPVTSISTGLRVLVVEDHDATAHSICRILERDGNTVTLAVSLAQAFQEIAAGTFDLLISDLGLPDGHGADLPPVIRRKGEVPCIAITGYGQEKDFQRTQEAGFVAHLVKPVTIADLRNAVSAAVILKAPVA